MKKKSLNILSAITIALAMLGTNVYAQGTDSRIGSIARERGEKGAIDATPLTKAEANKKYPSKTGTYPAATRDAHDASGVVSSPYPPHDKYNCSKVNHGGLVLDVHAKQVFVYP
jgi:hypothetical protein